MREPCWIEVMAKGTGAGGSALPFSLREGKGHKRIGDTTRLQSRAVPTRAAESRDQTP